MLFSLRLPIRRGSEKAVPHGNNIAAQPKAFLQIHANEDTIPRFQGGISARIGTGQMKEKAVALEYDPRNPTVPTITAAGEGAIAQQILEIAFASGVKVREDANLVEILSTLEVGSEIPVIAFAAVAEILSHVYNWEVRRDETIRQQQDAPFQ
jgi:flagellar biosynthesis protein